MFALAVDDWTLDWLAAFDAAATDDEDDGTDQSADAAENGLADIPLTPASAPAIPVQ